MGLFQKIFGSRADVKASRQYFQMLNGYTPVFCSWGGQIYESERVRASIDAKARHISKLNITIQGSAKPGLMRKLNDAPNEFQTWSQFLYRTSTILDVRNTAFITPVFDTYGQITGIYSIAPQRYELVEVGGEPWIRFTFERQEAAALRLSEVGILTKHQYRSDFFGESNNSLDPTMELINLQNQGIKEGVKSGASFRFYATLSNWTTNEDLAVERANFNATNLAKGGGMLLFPNTYKDIKQVEAKPFIIDAEQMKIIDNNVYNYFGTNEKVLQNSAYGDELGGFYDGVVEPFSIQLSEVLTKMLYTPKERNTGNKIVVSANRLQYMGTQAKISLAANLGDRGVLMIDEIRELFNYPPLPNGEGNHVPIRGEYYYVDEGKNNE